MSKRYHKKNAVALIIREGRPVGFQHEWRAWRTIVGLTKECIHVPSRDKPLIPSGENIHRFRTEKLSYFTALCDVYKVNQDTFNENLFNMAAKDTAAMFPPNVQDKIKSEILKWKNPQKYMRKKSAKWRNDCLPMVLITCDELYPTFARLSICFHDMTFVRPKNYNPGIHLNFQRLFQIIFPFMRVDTNVGMRFSTLHQEYLDDILTQSKKKWQDHMKPSEDFVSELYPFQEKCLSWMMDRETNAQTTSDWGWHKVKLNDSEDSNFHFFASVFGHLSLTRPSKGVRGGLLAQEMGMGKTVEMLALMATNNVKSVGPTLVVVPTTMLSVWQSEAKKHVPSFKVVKFHGPRRTKCMDDLRNADIILTTYRIVVLETQKHVPTIGSIRFGRIVLDESHELRDASSATTKAVCRLYAPIRWCASATPWPKVMNSVSSMLAFLGVDPFSEVRNLSAPYDMYSAAQMILRNYDHSTPLLLRKVLTEFTWYQRKRHVRLNLPSLTYTDELVEHDNMEVYQHLKNIVQIRIKNDSESSHRNIRTRMMHYSRWLRLAASHIAFNQTFCYGIPDTSQRAQSQIKTIDSFIESLGNGQYDQNLNKPYIRGLKVRKNVQYAWMLWIDQHLHLVIICFVTNAFNLRTSMTPRKMSFV